MQQKTDLKNSLSIVEFTSQAALTWAKRGDIALWVQRFLTVPEFGKNVEMAQVLRKLPTFWHGPIQSSLRDLVRTCGPEPEMRFQEDAGSFNQKIARFVSLIKQGVDFPLLLVEVRNQKHFIADGAHRHEAMIRSGKQEYWTIWYAHDPKEFNSLKWHQELSIAK